MYWTIQNKRVLEIIKEDSVYTPDFTLSQITPGMEGAYCFILKAFNAFNPGESKGLVFAFDNTPESPLKSVDEVKAFFASRSRLSFIEKADVNSGLLANGDYYLLQLDGYSEDIYTLPLDIALFEALSEYFTSRGEIAEKDSPVIPVLNAILQDWNCDNRFYGWMNSFANMATLRPTNIMQYHLPFIREENVVSMWPLQDIV